LSEQDANRSLARISLGYAAIAREFPATDAAKMAGRRLAALGSREEMPGQFVLSWGKPSRLATLSPELPSDPASNPHFR
jgi:hypothetical protein